MLDSEGEPLRRGIEAEPFLVSPNQGEAEDLVGQELAEQEDFAFALEEIAELGARNVLITQESGCYALLRENRHKRRTTRAPRSSTPSRRWAPATCSSPASSPRSTEGEPEDALRSAVAAGTAATLEVGAGRFDPRRLPTCVRGRADARSGRVGSC